MKKVAFQGSKGAYSEVALYAYFRDEPIETVGLELSEEVCEAVETKAVDMAILPVENSIVGNVAVNMDLLYHHGFFVVGEHYLAIRHCLIGLPGAKLSDIASARSHPVALAQCRGFLNAHGIKPVPAFDTAGSCLPIASRQRREEGAIASSLAAEAHGLKVLKKDIAKVGHNITRFHIFCRDKGLAPPLRQEKTSLAFTTTHKPGALLAALQEFRNFDINLTRLVSRPIAEDPFSYSFFVDFRGAADDPYIRLALKKIAAHTTHMKILGSYPQGQKPPSKAERKKGQPIRDKKKKS